MFLPGGWHVFSGNQLYELRPWSPKWAVMTAVSTLGPHFPWSSSSCCPGEKCADERSLCEPDRQKCWSSHYSLLTEVVSMWHHSPHHELPVALPFWSLLVSSSFFTCARVQVGVLAVCGGSSSHNFTGHHVTSSFHNGLSPNFHVKSLIPVIPLVALMIAAPRLWISSNGMIQCLPAKGWCILSVSIRI